MAQSKTITEKAPHSSKILSVEKGKNWGGDNGVTFTEYRVEFANGHLPTFNVKATPKNPDRNFPFKTGDTIAYNLTEKEMYNKITQYAQIDMTKTIQLQNKSVPVTQQKPVPMAKEDSIALAVAAKLAETTFNSAGWQETLSIKPTKAQLDAAKKADKDVTIEVLTGKVQAQAQTKMLSSIGQLTMAYYKLLTKQPQS